MNRTMALGAGSVSVVTDKLVLFLVPVAHEECNCKLRCSEVVRCVPLCPCGTVARCPRYATAVSRFLRTTMDTSVVQTTGLAVSPGCASLP